MKSGPSAPPKSWLLGLKTKAMGSICWSHPEPTMAIPAAHQERADRQLRQNSREQTLAN